jgi:hypothetical protein
MIRDLYHNEEIFNETNFLKIKNFLDFSQNVVSDNLILKKNKLDFIDPI